MKYLLFFLLFTSFQLRAQDILYVRGTGYNSYSSVKPRIIKLGNQVLASHNVSGNGRGLCLTILDASTHNHISSLNYDTFTSSTASNDLATALNNLGKDQIGILTSNDAWENALTTNLISAARRLGLTKLASGKGATHRRPYAAIFKGAESTLKNNQVIEIMQSSSSLANPAEIATYLIEDNFIGNSLSNSLIAADGNDNSAGLLLDSQGRVGISTFSPDEKLTVKGNIHAEEVRVDLSVPAPDYVFEDNYILRSLSDLKNYLNKNKHLPEVPSATEFEENGITLGEVNMLLLKKIEELTLYLIQQDDANKKQQELIDKLIEQISQLNKQ